MIRTRFVERIAHADLLQTRAVRPGSGWTTARLTASHPGWTSLVLFCPPHGCVVTRANSRDTSAPQWAVDMSIHGTPFRQSQENALR
jgi:hypothetical protein